MTLTTPPVLAIATIMSSVRLRGTSAIARHRECVAITGLVEVATLSQNALSDRCETSTTTPSLFIARITCSPKSVSPRVFPTSPPEEPPQALLTDQAPD